MGGIRPRRAPQDFATHAQCDQEDDDGDRQGGGAEAPDALAVARDAGEGHRKVRSRKGASSRSISRASGKCSDRSVFFFFFYVAAISFAMIPRNSPLRLRLRLCYSSASAEKPAIYATVVKILSRVP